MLSYGLSFSQGNRAFCPMRYNCMKPFTRFEWRQTCAYSMLLQRLRHSITLYVIFSYFFTGLMGSNNIELLRIFEIEEALIEMMQKEVFKFFTESDETKKV